MVNSANQKRERWFKPDVPALAYIVAVPVLVFHCRRAVWGPAGGGYLRIARPGIQSDNIGYHKDTWYGGHPAEVTAWIPLVDVDEKAAIKVRVVETADE